MKYSILALLILTHAHQVIAQARNNQRQGQGQQQGQGQGQGMTIAQDCMQHLNEVEQNPNAEDQARQKALPRFKNCENANKVAINYGKTSLPSQNGFQTADGRATCKQAAGYTLDWDSCRSTASLYNGLVVAAQAFEMVQEQRAKNAQTESQNNNARRMAEGDVQGAALQSARDNNESMKSINNEKAMAYTAAVAALGSKIASWKDSIDKVCGNDPQCKKDIESAQSFVGESDLFINKDMKAVFITALAEYTAKALAAGLAARQYKNNEEAVAEIQRTYEDDQIVDIQIDKCQVNPTAKECLRSGPLVSGGGLVSTGGFNIDGAGNNSFDLGGDVEEFGDLGDAATEDSQKVAAITSPFESEAKEANDILDQARAASAGSGNAPAGGAGGGGMGGMGGGGSASLGNDTKTPDESAPDAEIKAKKASAGYASGGATGFSAVKSAKEDTNPFANLFDQKGSEGGIEEDRSIASNDIDEKNSELFEKISKKYSEMHTNKRIEANNLE